MSRRAIVLATLLACDGEPAPVLAPPATPAMARDAGVAIVVDAPPTSFIGVLTAAESVDIAPRIAGLIVGVKVRTGDVIAAGQVLVEMDPVQLREELRAAEAALAAAGAALRQAEVDVADAKRKFELETKSAAAGVSATSLVDEARLGVARAEAAASRARSSYAAEAARLQTARDHVKDSQLKAPFAGTVAARFRDAGNRIDAGAPILRIVGRGRMRLRFAVPPDQVKRLAIGGRVTARVETVATPVSAEIKQIPPGIDPASGMVIVEAELGDGVPPGDLRPGLGASVTL